MAHRLNLGILLASALAFAGSQALAEEPHEEHGAAQHAPAPHAAPRAAPHAAPREAPHPEPHPGPGGYQRLHEPEGWNARPATVDQHAYQHNFQAARSFKVGPYHRPAGWSPHHWAYGQTLPRAYWASPYILADYWLFAVEVPPAGYEWVRDGADALLVNTANGEILQVEYGVFG